MENIMITCDICGKELKNTQGLRGHKYFAHFEAQDNHEHPTQQATQQPLSHKSAARPAAEDRMSKLEERLTKLELATGVRERNEIEKMLGINEQTIIERVAEFAKQLKSIKTESASHAELRSIADQVTGLAQRLTSFELLIGYVQDGMRNFRTDLDSKADDEYVIKLEERISQLEGKQTEILKSLTELRGSQVKIQAEVVKFANTLMSKLAEVLEPIREQLREQKQVTDWARRKFELRPVKN
jgi:hypothetical protein